LINGPTSAISLVVFSALAFLDPNASSDIYEAMFLLGVMVGIIQIGIAVFKLGDLTRYISESVILGFMAGAAVRLAIGQIGNALGVHEKGTGNQHVLYRLWLTLVHGDPFNLKALTISAVTILLAVLLRKVVRRYRLPQLDMFVALLAIAASAYLAGWSLPDDNGKTAVAVIGALKASLPQPHIPEIHWNWVAHLSSSAVAIAFLGLLEALSIAKSIAHHTRQPLDYNRQCLAEGVANLIGVTLSILLFVPRAAKLKATELITSPEGVVRERLTSDTQCTAVVVWDFEGEFFFGAAPELDRYFDALKQRVQLFGSRYVVLRFKRVRNPDVVCIERLEHFLRETQQGGLTVLLAGLRPEFLTAIDNLRFTDWYPAAYFFAEEDERYSATLRAVRHAYALLGDENSCQHCAGQSRLDRKVGNLYYLV